MAKAQTGTNARNTVASCPSRQGKWSVFEFIPVFSSYSLHASALLLEALNDELRCLYEPFGTV